MLVEKVPSWRSVQTTDQVLGGDGLSAAAGGHHHLGQTLPHVRQAAGEGEHRHDFTGHRDVKLGLEDILRIINSNAANWTRRRNFQFARRSKHRNLFKHLV